MIKDMSTSELWDKIINDRAKEQRRSNISDNMGDFSRRIDEFWKQVEGGTLEFSGAELEFAKRLAPKCPNWNGGEPNECKCQWCNDA